MSKNPTKKPFVSYSEKLKDPRWQKKRLEILDAAGWKCQACDDGENTLHVHHVSYLKGKDPWDYPNSLLVVLCEDCHSFEHDGAHDGISSYIELLKENGILLTDIYHLMSEAICFCNSRKQFNEFSTCMFERAYLEHYGDKPL